MPLTIEGFGTKFYGESNVRDDGTFVTTEWVTLLHIPVFPLRSLRVLRDSDADENAVIIHSEGYVVVEKIAIAWGQVALIYLFLCFIFIWWCVAFTWSRPRISRALDGPDAWPAVWYVLLLSAAFAAPFFIVWFMRKVSRGAYARKSA